jgi:hypothetical protein
MSAPTPRPRIEWRALPDGWTWGGAASPGASGGIGWCYIDHPVAQAHDAPIPVVLAVLHAAGYDVPEVTS